MDSINCHTAHTALTFIARLLGQQWQSWVYGDLIKIFTVWFYRKRIFHHYSKENALAGFEGLFIACNLMAFWYLFYICTLGSVAKSLLLPKSFTSLCPNTLFFFVLDAFNNYCLNINFCSQNTGDAIFSSDLFWVA